ncbi:MAG: hypothetical protein M1821_009890 [Bathelium mastoideum]|nr:MAG: hypothetical protein M1821_009890 [Bathelium mastoideum]KAI9690348.1 MAG: hypothetical protein M1822_009310 [Bathelium mastoideum]
MVLTTSTKMYSPDELKAMARWIRDDIDPEVAREGAAALCPDCVLQMHDTLTVFAQDPLGAGISLASLQYSRIHRALLEVATKATRWPGRLIDLCDDVLIVWEKRFGRLKDVPLLLYGEGGRLWRVLPPGYFTHEEMIRQVRDQYKLRGGMTSAVDMAALEYGHLGCTPGQWWLDPIFAFRDGIISNLGDDEDIVYDGNGAYAIVLSDSNEVNSSDPSVVTLRTRPTDKGRYRLAAGEPNSRNPVRVLRTYTLQSPWAPKVGIRYEGLYKVDGLSCKTEDGVVMYYPRLVREPGQRSMDEVLNRPWADEREDYAEYRRLRNLWREDARRLREEALKHGPQHTSKKNPESPERSSDGSSEGVPDQFEGRVQIRSQMSTVEDKAARVLGKPNLPTGFCGEAAPLLPQNSDPKSETSKSSKTERRVIFKTGGTKDGATDEAKHRTRHSYDGSEERHSVIAQHAPMRARASLPDTGSRFSLPRPRTRYIPPHSHARYSPPHRGTRNIPPEAEESPTRFSTSNSPSSGPPANTAVDIGRRFAYMNLNQMQTINAQYSEHVYRRRMTPDTFATQRTSRRNPPLSSSGDR